MLRIRDIMTRDVVHLSPQTTIREAMEILSTSHLSGAPVLSGSQVVGLLSMTDILGFIVSAPQREVREGTESAESEWNDADLTLDDDAETEAATLDGEVWYDSIEGAEGRVDDTLPSVENLLDQRTVEDVMNREVFSLSPGASVRAAASMMRDRGIHRVVVMEGKRMKGIVSAFDIARAVSDRRIRRPDSFDLKLPPGEPSTWTA